MSETKHDNFFFFEYRTFKICPYQTQKEWKERDFTWVGFIPFLRYELSAMQHTRWWGQVVATAAEDEKKSSCSWNASYRISSAVRSMCWAEENGESGFLWHTPVEESEAAAKQKWQQRFGIRVSSCTQRAAEKEKGKGGGGASRQGQLVVRWPRGLG